MTTRVTWAQDVNTFRADQVTRLKNYVVAAIQPSGLVRDSVVINGGSFHPATPDAAGFALLALSSFDHWDNLNGTAVLPDAEQRVVDILTAHAGQKPGVMPARSADGHFVHFMNLNNGAVQGGGWDESYSPISTALLVSGAQFAKNHFPHNATIASLADQLTNSVNFNAAIHPSLDGRIYHNMTPAGGGAGVTSSPWNEYMLVESLALRETNNARALAVKDLWLDVDNIPKRAHPAAGNFETLTDNPGSFAPAFWVQQMHFFNGDFRHSDDFETYFENQKLADKFYSSNSLGEEYRYGLTAGVSPFGGYQVDKIFGHNGNVFSPEAVAAWGDMATLLEFYSDQAYPPNDPRYKYGMLRVSAFDPSLTPADAGLVDHLFLLFGLIESIDSNFFPDRVFGATPGDYNRDGEIDDADYLRWRSTFGSQTSVGADGNRNGAIDAADYVTWRKLAGLPGTGGTTSIPEPAAFVLLAIVAFAGNLVRKSRTHLSNSMRGIL